MTIGRGNGSTAAGGVLVHGLAGCHRSGYLVRIAAKLNARGVRTFAWTARDRSGSRAGGEAVSRRMLRRPASVVQFVEQLCPASPITLLGFSLGETSSETLGRSARKSSAASRAAAVNPPIDLEQSVVASRWSLRPYDKYFVRSYSAG